MWWFCYCDKIGLLFYTPDLLFDIFCTSIIRSVKCSMNDGLNIDQISFTSATMKQLYHWDRNKITFLFIYNSIEWFVLKITYRSRGNNETPQLEFITLWMRWFDFQKHWILETGLIKEYCHQNHFRCNRATIQCVCSYKLGANIVEVDFEWFLLQSARIPYDSSAWMPSLWSECMCHVILKYS